MRCFALTILACLLTVGIPHVATAMTHDEATVVLEQAIRAQNEAAAKLALERGANPNAGFIRRATPGSYDLLSLAIEFHKPGSGIVGLLLDRGANPNAIIADHLRVRDIWLHTEQVTMLMKAAQRGFNGQDRQSVDEYLALLSLLIKHGARINVFTDSGASPFLVALLFKPGDVAAMVNPALQLFLDHGLKINARNKYSETYLLRYLLEGGDVNVDTIEFLLRHGVSPSLPDNLGRTPLMMVAAGCWPAAIQTLRAAGADVVAKDRHGETALEYALRKGCDSRTLQALH